MNETQEISVDINLCAEEYNAWAVIVGSEVAEAVEMETGMPLHELNERDLVYAPIYYAPLIVPHAIMFVLHELGDEAFPH